MKKMILILLFIFSVVSCTPSVAVQDEEDQDFVRTQIAATLYAELAATDTPIPTPTAEPTATIPAIGTRSNPVPIGQPLSLVYEDIANFQITIIELIRGQDAWNLLYQANYFNDPPVDGMEYILAKVGVNFQATTQQDYLLSIDMFSFKSVSNNQMVDTAVVVNPEPILDLDLFAGGYGEGYISVLVFVDDPAPLIVYEDWLSLTSTPFYFSTK